MTYMQKIDASAMMRELTEHETEIVSGGFGESDWTVNLPDSAAPAGTNVDNITNAEFVFDSTTNELTTILTYNVPGADDLREGFRGYGDNDANGAARGTVTTTTTTRNSATGTFNVSGTINIQILGRGVTFTINGTINTPSTSRTTTTTITRPFTPPPPPQSGGCNSGRRNGSGCIRPN